jgi:hypothetical protein
MLLRGLRATLSATCLAQVNRVFSARQIFGVLTTCSNSVLLTRCLLQEAALIVNADAQTATTGITEHVLSARCITFALTKLDGQ